MDSNPELKNLSLSMFDFEFLDFAQQVQSHGSYFSGMSVSIPYGKAAHHHIGIANGFNLT